MLLMGEEVFGPDPTKVVEKMKDVFAPVIDDPAAANWERVAASWWSLQREAEIASARKEVALQKRLAPLYERLKTATSEEWETYAKLVSGSRFVAGSAVARAFVKRSQNQSPGG